MKDNLKKMENQKCIFFMKIREVSNWSYMLECVQMNGNLTKQLYEHKKYSKCMEVCDVRYPFMATIVLSKLKMI